jgi:oxygen-dependent protoporphyrinogen oxidase
LVWSVLKERYWPPNRPVPLSVPEQDKAALSLRMKVYDDESVDSFLTRRFGAKVARLFGSALVHGIYAADSRRLSVRASFPSLWEAENRGKGSVITGILRKNETEGPSEAYETGDMLKIMADASVFSFKEGINQLPLSLMERLSSMPSVDLRLSCGVAGIQPRQQSILVRMDANQGSSLLRCSYRLSFKTGLR